MAAAPRRRSTFWIVSTHVLTTGFAMPFVAALVSLAALQAMGSIDFYLAIIVSLSIQALGYIGGAYYSLSYIRKVAIARDPLACIIPSNITFTVLAALGLGWSIKNLGLVNFPMILALVALFYIGITVIFALVTQQGFRRMAGHLEPRGFEVQPVSVAPLGPPPVDPSI